MLKQAPYGIRELAADAGLKLADRPQSAPGKTILPGFAALVALLPAATTAPAALVMPTFVSDNDKKVDALTKEIEEIRKIKELNSHYLTKFSVLQNVILQLNNADPVQITNLQEQIKSLTKKIVELDDVIKQKTKTIRLLRTQGSQQQNSVSRQSRKTNTTNAPLITKAIPRPLTANILQRAIENTNTFKK